ncbi:MAG: SMC-Scp complex subunit ScpB [Armatimonadetes bacterium]|nr:SMC-Scp complex subunit ScpB [Armatimonadota bacterium]
MSLAAAVECVLFVASEPVAIKDLATALNVEPTTAQWAVEVLQQRLDSNGSGLQVVQIAGGYQLATRAEHAETIARLVARNSNRLSRAALETLAIIAYRQPITQPEIEAVRGVTSAGVVKTLLDRNLIVEAGRKPTIGRPILYKTTHEFLHYFGLNELADLPQMDSYEGPHAPVSAPSFFAATAEVS